MPKHLVEKILQSKSALEGERNGVQKVRGSNPRAPTSQYGGLANSVLLVELRGCVWSM